MSKEAATEAEALADILEWSRDRPVWQRDALRRLMTADELSDADILELTALCADPTQPHRALSDADLAAPGGGSPPVQLKAIRGVQNVNALAENQKLSFLEKGVTVVYGDNGSGKSGYVRILKQACRARGPDAKILKNIYSVPSGSQKADFDYLAGGQSQKATWQDGATDTRMLSAISVFDTATATVHVDATNDVAYTPFPMKVLERLVQACRLVKGKFDAEIAAIEQQTPQALRSPPCAADTVVGGLVASLGKETRPDAVKALAKLTAEEETRLAQFTADLNQDVKPAITRLQGHKRRLELLQQQLASVAGAASDETALRLAQLNADYLAKKEASAIAAQSLFAADPLPGVGGDTWRTLWEAARDYSVSAAYPAAAFPVTESDSRCVLCQQALGPEAAARLQRFEAFVQDRTKQEEMRAFAAIEALAGDLKRHCPSVRGAVEELWSIGEDMDLPELSECLRRYFVQARWRLRGILLTKSVPAFPLPPLPEAGLKSQIEAVEGRISGILADENSETRRALRREFQELRDRKWLSGMEADVIAEIGRKKTIADKKVAVRDTRQNEITGKASALAEALVTDRLRGRFAQEVDHLKVAGLAVELRKERSQHGVPLFRVSLIHKPDTKAGAILSEGEHRCVALAAFMAELSTTDDHSGIVFDDPVSSLDHLHREAIAARLADEGRSRQVIVFTHDLPFLFLLERACRTPGEEKEPTNVAIRHIARRGGNPGFCENTPPMKAQSTAKRVETIAGHLGNTRFQFEQDPEGIWLVTAKGLLGQIRDTWEGAVESIVAPVLRTFSSKVDTKGFAKLSAVTESDARSMRTAYGRCSELLHKASEALNPSVPTPGQIENEIQCLRDWLDSLLERQKSIQTG